MRAPGRRRARHGPRRRARPDEALKRICRRESIDCCAIVLANIVGFGCVTAMDVWGVFSGSARPAAKLFLVIHLLMTVAFFVAGRASVRAQESRAV
jgi:hypothetical protein